MVHNQSVELFISRAGAEIVRGELNRVELVLLPWVLLGGSRRNRVSLAVRTPDLEGVFLARAEAVGLVGLLGRGPATDRGQIVEAHGAVVGARKQILLVVGRAAWAGGAWLGRGLLGREELDAVDEALVVVESVEELSCGQLPHDDLGVFSRARNKLVALADVDFGDVVEVAVQGGLQVEGLPVEDLDDANKT